MLVIGIWREYEHETECVRVRARVHMCVFVHVCVCVHMCVCACTYVCGYVRVCMCLYVRERERGAAYRQIGQAERQTETDLEIHRDRETEAGRDRKPVRLEV